MRFRRMMAASAASAFMMTAQGHIPSPKTAFSMVVAPAGSGPVMSRADEISEQRLDRLREHEQTVRQAAMIVSSIAVSEACAMAANHDVPAPGQPPRPWVRQKHDLVHRDRAMYLVAAWDSDAETLQNDAPQCGAFVLKVDDSPRSDESLQLSMAAVDSAGKAIRTALRDNPEVLRPLYANPDNYDEVLGKPPVKAALREVTETFVKIIDQLRTPISFHTRAPQKRGRPLPGLSSPAQ